MIPSWEAAYLWLLAAGIGFLAGWISGTLRHLASGWEIEPEDDDVWLKELPARWR